MAHQDEISKLSDETLLWINGQLYEPADRGLGNAIMNVFWSRFGVFIGAWPTHRFGSSPPAWTARLDHDHLIGYCRKASGPADPAHRPRRMLKIPGERGERGDVYIECSCGQRKPAWDLQLAQRVGRAAVWETQLIDGVPHFIVCSQARFADDVGHAPRWDPTIEPRCICGWTLDSEECERRGQPLRLLPVF